MGHRQGGEDASTNRRPPAAVAGEYELWLGTQPLAARTREAYAAVIAAFVLLVAWGRGPRAPIKNCRHAGILRFRHNSTSVG